MVFVLKITSFNLNRTSYGIWVNRMKPDKYGNIEKYSSRFVVCGNRQIECDSYKADEISLHKDSLRTCLSLDAGSDFKRVLEDGQEILLKLLS
mmetsp:Transcript_12651/g.16328  ORF Transcript_12651/g.16328 Transcript_12651/m.16328 type:complete len:93 (-) Transcript_12651:694-972(-)